MNEAINRGFRRANGDILAWLNCDEQYLPETLDKVRAWFEENPEHDILFGDVILVTPEGTPLSYRHVIQPYSGHIRSCTLPTLSAATFIRRKVIDQGFYLPTEYKAISDAVWVDTLLRKVFRAGILNQPLAIFTQTGVNLGQTDLSYEEFKSWKIKTQSTGFLRSLYWRSFHRLRKLFMGAYRTWNVSIDIYTAGSSARVTKKARIGFRWIKG